MVRTFKRGQTYPTVPVKESQFTYDDENMRDDAAIRFLGAVVLAHVTEVVEKSRRGERGLIGSANEAAAWLRGLGIANVTGGDLLKVVQEVAAIEV